MRSSVRRKTEMAEFRPRSVSITELTPLMEEILSQGGSVELTITGNSMRPMLLDRCSRVRLTAADGLRRGDIPLYRRDSGTYVLHRVVAEQGGRYTCCGDAQWSLEPGIRRDQIAAVVTHFARKKRWVSRDNFWYGLYWRLWVAIRPLRRLIFGGARRMKQILAG